MDIVLQFGKSHRKYMNNITSVKENKYRHN